MGCIEIANLVMRGCTKFYLNNHDAAREDANTTINLASQTGKQLAESLAHSVLHLLFYYRADYAAAMEQAQNGFRLARELGTKRFEAENLHNLGVARAGLGFQEGERDLEQAYTLCRETGGLSYMGSWILGSLAWVTGDPHKRRKAPGL